MVFAADLYPNYRDSTLIMDRHWRAGRFILHADIVDDGTELPYEILRDLRRGLDAHFSYLAYETSAVEYYLSCAHAQECTGILAGDPSRRDGLVEAVGEALEHIVARNASAAHGCLLFDAQTAAAEAGDDDAVFEYANALYFCIPRDFRVTFPTGNDDAANAVKDALFAAYAEQDIGFARVVNRQPPESCPCSTTWRSTFWTPKAPPRTCRTRTASSFRTSSPQRGSCTSHHQTSDSRGSTPQLPRRMPRPPPPTPRSRCCTRRCTPPRGPGQPAATTRLAPL